MIRKLIVYGAGGLGKETIELASRINNERWEIIGFADQQYEKIKQIHSYPVIGDINWLLNMEEEIDVIVALGDSSIRKTVVEKLSSNKKINFPQIIAPTAIISQHSIIGKGCIITDYSIVSTDVEIGNHVLINVNSTIGHDSKIESYCTINPGAKISGNDIIGSESRIGTGAQIIEKTIIGKGSTVGAGSTVLTNVPDHCTVIGNPARIMIQKKN